MWIIYRFSWFDKIKKVTISPINKKDNNCFQYAIRTVALNHEEIGKHSDSIGKQYNWEGISFSSEKDDWKKIKKSNRTIAPNVLYVKKEKIYPAYASKQN